MLQRTWLSFQKHSEVLEASTQTSNLFKLKRTSEWTIMVKTPKNDLRGIPRNEGSLTRTLATRKDLKGSDHIKRSQTFPQLFKRTSMIPPKHHQAQSDVLKGNSLPATQFFHIINHHIFSFFFFVSLSSSSFCRLRSFLITLWLMMWKNEKKREKCVYRHILEVLFFLGTFTFCVQECSGGYLLF